MANVNMKISRGGDRRRARGGGGGVRVGWGRWLRWAVMVILGMVLTVLLFFRYVGLPQQFGQRLDEELKRNGLEVRYSGLYLDALGRVVARDLRVSHRDAAGQQMMEVERLSFAFNWLSWWRGEPFLEAAVIRNAALELPLDEESVLRLNQVGGVVEFRPGFLLIREMRAELGDLEVQISGRLGHRDFRPGPPLRPEQRHAQAEAWRKVEGYLREIEGGGPLRLMVEGDMEWGAWHEGRLRVRLEGQRRSWRGVLVERLGLEIALEEGLVRCEGELLGLRGGLRLEGAWTAGSQKARVRFESDLDLSLLAPAVPGAAGEFLRGVQFHRLPWHEGVLEADWGSQGKGFWMQVRTRWQDVAVGGTYLEEFYLPFSTDGRRWMVPEFRVRGRSGDARGQFFYDGAEQVRASLESTLVPTDFAPLFGPRARPFFRSLEFRGGGPKVQARVEGRGLQPSGWKVEGKVECEDFSYKGVALEAVQSSFRYADHEIHLPDLKVRRSEGEGSGDVRHNFRTRMVWLKGVKARLHLRETARIIGNKMEEYAQPYRFHAAPWTEASGTVDVDGQKLTDLKVRVVSPEGMTYRFLGKDVELSKIDADLIFKGSRLEVLPRQPFGVFGGSCEARLGVELTRDAAYQARARLVDVDFGQLMRTYFENREVSGRLNAEVTLRGSLNDMASIDGDGALTIEKGVLYNIPIFGGFSEVLNSIIPNLGYAEADRARAEFSMKNGVIRIDKLDVYSAAFALIGNGTYDYIRDQVDLNMRVNARGILGTALFPFSKLFEYEGKGSMNDTRWSPKVF